MDPIEIYRYQCPYIDNQVLSVLLLGQATEGIQPVRQHESGNKMGTMQVGPTQ